MATKISELPTGQKVGNILNETLNVGGAATTSTTPTVTIPRASAATNAVHPALRLQHTTSGTPAVGLGVSLEFETETAAGNNEVTARIESAVTDTTSTTEDGNLVFYTMVNGTLTRMLGLISPAVYSVGNIAGGGSYTSFYSSVSNAQAPNDAQRTFIIETNSGKTFASSGGHYGLTANAAGTDVGVTADVAFARHAANVGKITNGSTTIHSLLGGGAAIASAAALPVPTGRVCHVTGTTTITSITSTNLGSGVVVTLIFDGALTVTDGGNLKLAGNFTTSADDTLTLVYDGTNWYEIARSVN